MGGSQTAKFVKVFSLESFCYTVYATCYLNHNIPVTNEGDDGEGSSNDTWKGVRILAEEGHLQWTKLTGRLSQVTTNH